MADNQNEKPTKYISAFIDCKNNLLYEQVDSGVYIAYNEKSNEIKKVRQIETNEFIFKPIINKTTEIRAIPLPLRPCEYGSTLELANSIGKHVYRYVDVSDRFRKLCSWYTMMTWITDNLSTINYLRVLGNWGVGKSRFFDVVGGLCYKPIPMAGAVNPAPVYRLMDMWKGTMLLDEFVMNNSDESSYIVQILNSGIQRGRYVWRCDKEDINDVEPFDPFGPKIIASRVPFKDNALESRCITEKMRQTKRKDIPIDLSEDFYREQEQLRNQLLMFRLRNWNKVDGNVIRKIELPDCTKRLQQMIVPFAVTFYQFPKIIEDLKLFVDDYYNKQVEYNSTTLEGAVVNALFELRISGEEQITSKSIKETMGQLGYETDKPSDVGIGKARSGLGIKAKQKTVCGISKMSVIWDDELMDELMKRYVTKERQKYFKEKLTRAKVKPVKSNTSDWEIKN